MDFNNLDYYYKKLKFGEDNFHRLMSKRVKNVLLVSTFYDAYILEQDGRLAEQISGSYKQLNLSTEPVIINAPTGKRAIQILKKQKIDLIISMMRIGDITALEFSEYVKRHYNDLPFLLLINNPPDLSTLDKKNTRFIDKVFLWKVDSKIFLSMIKYIEDKKNIENDTKNGLVRVIILVEDSVYFYSTYFSMLLTMVMQQTQVLIEEEENDINKRLRMRARPKIILVDSYEDALYYYNRFNEYLLAIISDICLFKQGRLDPNAGIDLFNEIGVPNANLVTVFQSTSQEKRSIAERMGVDFLSKNSSTLLHDLQNLLIQKLGFGDFIVKDRFGKEIQRISSLNDFEQKIKDIPGESLIYHGKRNSFSSWLIARGEITISKKIRSIITDDKSDPEILRGILVNAMEVVRMRRDRGKIVNFNTHTLDIDFIITKAAGGSLGGKGRGIAFLNALWSTIEYKTNYPNVRIKIPKTIIIGVNEFDHFIQKNIDINEILKLSDREIKEKFLKAKIGNKLYKRLKSVIEAVNYPVAVRSSGLLEDSLSQPFAGVYATYMLPNTGSEELRLSNLVGAIKSVFASIFIKKARQYIEGSNLKITEEKMAVVIQQIVGNRVGNNFFPHISGVAQSHNYYPTSYLKHSDGISEIVIGLGKAVVEENGNYRFCPKYPKMDIISENDYVSSLQKKYFALNMAQEKIDFLDSVDNNLVEVPVVSSEEFADLKYLVSYWDYENQRMNPGVSKNRPLIANFANILKYDYFPLGEIISDVLVVGKKTMGIPVEIEFAVDLRKKDGKTTFYILQIRPLMVKFSEIEIDPLKFDKSRHFLFSTHSMGNGKVEHIKNIIYLHPSLFDPTKTLVMLKEIEELNEVMKRKKEDYILIGVGRWGSRDRFLGIPVKWAQISKAKIIVEVATDKHNIEASQGTHFFHNLISMNIGYITIPFNNKNAFLDWDWLCAQKKEREYKYFSHISFEKPFRVKMDGKNGLVKVERPLGSKGSLS